MNERVLADWEHTKYFSDFIFVIHHLFIADLLPEAAPARLLDREWNGCSRYEMGNGRVRQR